MAPARLLQLLLPTVMAGCSFTGGVAPIEVDGVPLRVSRLEETILFIPTGGFSMTVRPASGEFRAEDPRFPDLARRAAEKRCKGARRVGSSHEPGQWWSGLYGCPWA